MSGLLVCAYRSYCFLSHSYGQTLPRCDRTGCIFAELLRGEPLFVSESEIGQLMRIFEKCGTPSNATWEGVECYPHFMKFPQWPRRSVGRMFPQLDKNGRDLLDRMLTSEP